MLIKASKENTIQVIAYPDKISIIGTGKDGVFLFLEKKRERNKTSYVLMQAQKDKIEKIREIREISEMSYLPVYRKKWRAYVIIGYMC